MAPFFDASGKVYDPGWTVRQLSKWESYKAAVEDDFLKLDTQNQARTNARKFASHESIPRGIVARQRRKKEKIHVEVAGWELIKLLCKNKKNHKGEREASRKLEKALTSSREQALKDRIDKIDWKNAGAAEAIDLVKDVSEGQLAKNP